MKKFLILIGIIAGLSGCASGVKLDSASVEDRSGSGYGTTTGNTAGASSLDARSLNGLNGTNNTNTSDGLKPGPAGVESIIYFDYDSYAVKPEFQGVIEAHARFLRADRTRRANLEGNTDERGGSEYNLALGQKRAEAVRRALVLLGVPDNQLEAVSYGKEKPAELGSTEAAFAKNRRVEMTYR